MNTSSYYIIIVVLLFVFCFFRFTSKVIYKRRFLFAINFVAYFYIVMQSYCLATYIENDDSIFLFEVYLSKLFPDEILNIISLVFCFVFSVFCFPKYTSFSESSPFNSKQKIYNNIMIFSIMFFLLCFPAIVFYYSI